MELRDYLKILRRRKISIVLVSLLVGAAAAAFSLSQTPQYASDARLFISTSQSDDASLFQGGQFSAQRVKSYADLVTSRELAERVIADLGLEIDAGRLVDKVSAEVVLETVNLALTVTDADPYEAQRIAQTYAQELSDIVRELETPPGKVDAPIKATIVDAASLPDSAVSPRPVRDTGLGLALGLMLGMALAIVREILDTRIKTVDDITAVSDAPILGTIAFDSVTTKSPLITQTPPHSPRAEAFRVFRTNLQFVDVDTTNKVFVITSAVPGEGKTTTSTNLAISLAQAGVKTLLVEGDLRRPRASQLLGIDNAVGITSVLVGQVSLDNVLQMHDPSGLTVLPSGPVPPNPAELLQSKSMAEVMISLRAQFDVVVIDAPPLLPVTDAALLASEADGAIVVVRYGKTTRDQVRHALNRLAQVDAPLAGTVLTMAPNTKKGDGAGYGYGYGYGYAPLEERRGRGPERPAGKRVSRPRRSS